MSTHMDRLSSVDASLLAQEREGSHMHIGSVLLFEGPAPEAPEVAEHLEARLHLVPRYRQKLSFPAWRWAGRCGWTTPTSTSATTCGTPLCRRPGRWSSCGCWPGRVFSRRLDRSKPLWEMWLVEGLQDGRFAVINKTHHSLVDGVSGADLTAVIFDLQREGTEMPEAERSWSPAPEPGDVSMTARGVTDLAGAPLGLARRAVSAITSPAKAAAQAREVASGLGEVAKNTVVSAPRPR